jgi:hypothetical protein
MRGTERAGYRRIGLTGANGETVHEEDYISTPTSRKWRGFSKLLYEIQIKRIGRIKTS